MPTTSAGPEALDFDRCYAVVASRDRRFDGVFYTAVRTTGIYCRPSCPARTPSARNVTFHRTAAAAQGAGYRACERCLPDATPGSPEWDVAATVAGRAMRLIADGVVDREGVPGLARRLGYTPRHLGRLLGAELGAGPLALARTHRAQTARALLESTELALADVAFAAGFASVRQFNETVREVYAATPGELRSRRRRTTASTDGAIDLRVAVRTPFAGGRLRDFLAARALPGVETVVDGRYARTLALPHGPGTVAVDLPDLPGLPGGGVGHLDVRLRLHDLRDTAAALARVRALVDADADPVAVSEHLGADPALAPLVASRPGLRVPGHVDGAELVVRAVLGQQVSVAATRRLLTGLVADHGEPLASAEPGLHRLFPSPERLADADPAGWPMPRARAATVVRLAAALADGALVLDRGPERAEVRRRLLEQPGVGPWTADYVALRALGDPDVWLPGDAAVRRALAALPDADPRRWAPWRSYALMHLWTAEEAPTCGP